MSAVQYKGDSALMMLSCRGESSCTRSLVGLLGADKQAQGCAGEGLKPEGLSPRLRASLQAVTCSLVSLLGQTSKHRAAQVRG